MPTVLSHEFSTCIMQTHDARRWLPHDEVTCSGYKHASVESMFMITVATVIRSAISASIIPACTECFGNTQTAALLQLHAVTTCQLCCEHMLFMPQTQDIEMMGEFGYLIQSKAAVCFFEDWTLGTTTWRYHLLSISSLW